MKRSYLIATGLALLISLWLLIGYWLSPPPAPLGERPVAAVPINRMSVETRTQEARQITRQIVAQGQVEPNRAVTVRAETSGRVVEVVAREGRPVTAGEVLLRLAMDDRQARLQRAEALVKERQLGYESRRKLGDQGFQSQVLVEEAFAQLEAARADLAAIRLDIERTVIRTPFDGILEHRHSDLGDYVSVDGEVATIVDNDPLVVTVAIAQQDIGKVALGDTARISLAIGQETEGTIGYISPRAAAATRTFRVEIEIANPGNRIPSGISAEAGIPVGSVAAHFISPGLLSLNEDGVLGIKTVDNGDRVRFNPVTIVQAEASGLWVSGLPDPARIITIGQGFVRDGENVRVMQADSDDRLPVEPAAVGELSLLGRDGNRP